MKASAEESKEVEANDEKAASDPEVSLENEKENVKEEVTAK